MTVALTIGSFILISGLAFFLLVVIARLQQDPIQARLAAAAQGTVSIGGPPGLFAEDLATSLAGQLPQTRIDNGELSRELLQAGYYRPSARNDFLALRNALMIGVVILCLALVAYVGPQNQELALRLVIGGLVMAAICWSVPRLILRAQARARVNRIRRGLPFALDMTTMCLTGGLSLRDALGHVSREIFYSHPDLAVELLIVREQSDMSSLEHAVRQFAARMNIPEVSALAALLTHSERLGTDVVVSLRDYADSLRLKWRQTADEQSNKVGLKLLLPLTLCLLPAAMIFIWGPAIVELWRFFQGFSVPGIE